MTQTFEEWIKDMDWANPSLTEEAESNKGSAHLAWDARDVEVAEKDRRITELEALVETKRKNYEAMSSSELHLRGINIALESRIVAALALADEWECGGMHEEAYDVGKEQCAKEIRAALKEK